MEASDPILLSAPTVTKGLLILVINAVIAQVVVAAKRLFGLNKQANEILAYQAEQSAYTTDAAPVKGQVIKNTWTHGVFFDSLPFKSRKRLNEDTNKSIFASVNRAIKTAMLASFNEEVEALKTSMSHGAVKKMIEAELLAKKYLKGFSPETSTAARSFLISEALWTWIMEYAQAQTILAGITKTPTANKTPKAVNATASKQNLINKDNMQDGTDDEDGAAAEEIPPPPPTTTAQPPAKRPNNNNSGSRPNNNNRGRQQVRLGPINIIGKVFIPKPLYKFLQCRSDYCIESAQRPLRRAHRAVRITTGQQDLQ